MTRNKKQYKFWLLITILCATIVTIFMLSDMVTDPGHTLIMLGGDATKNYYTYLYHSVYGKGIWFSGMHYPFGDNIIYADAQPFLSIPLSYLHVTVQQALIVMHLAIATSYILAIVFSFRLLVHFGLDYFPALVFAILITILSPQVMRLQAGHYGLAYLCFIPMLFYWTAKYFNNSHWKYALYIFIAGLISGFLIPYFFAYTGIWIITYAVGYFIFGKRSVKERIKHILPLALSLLFIFLVLKCYLLFTDPIKDRPEYPWGALQSRSVKNDLFTSMHSPFWNYIKNKRPGYYISAGNEDGYAYIGITAIIVCSVSIILGIMAVVKKQKSSVIINNDKFSPIWLFICAVFLCLCLCIPFRWHIEWFYDLPFFRQFRALGRFSWAFYYITTIYTAIAIWTWYKRFLLKSKPTIAYLIIILPILIWSTEASDYINLTRSMAKKSQDNYKLLFIDITINSFLQAHHYKTNDFQAILSFPYYHYGSERFWLNTWASIPLTYTCRAALQLHLPMISMAMCRTSFAQSTEQVRLIAGPYADKSILYKMNNNPLLVLAFNDCLIDTDTKYLLEGANYIGDYENCKVYACYPQRVLENDKKNKAALLPIINTLSNDTCLHCSTGYYINHFNKKNDRNRIFESNAAIQVHDDTLIDLFPVSNLYNGQLYEFSTWVLMNKYEYKSPDFLIQALDNNYHVLKTDTIRSRESVDNNGLWFRLSKYIKMPVNTGFIRFSKINDAIPDYFALDEILMRPVNSIIISKFADGTNMVNNHIFKK